MRHLPKFKIGDPVYIKKPDLILFGKVYSVRTILEARWNLKRRSTRRKFKYLIDLEYPHVDRRRNNPKLRYLLVAESSLRYLHNDQEVINDFNNFW